MSRKSHPRSPPGSVRRFVNQTSTNFNSFAAAAARFTGRPAAFLTALALVLIWAAIGPFVGYSNTWQLIINTATTIITFLMVFLIQHTQNRDTLALQIKVAEIILTMHGAEHDLATAEDLAEESLEQIHQRLKRRSRNSPAKKSGSRDAPARR
jgi:low affinity Fe/Cu permease